MASVHLLLHLTGLHLLLAYSLFQTTIFYPHPIHLLLQSLELKRKYSLRVQLLFHSLNDTLIILDCIAESRLDMEDDIGISELYIVSTVPQEVAEEILGRAKEEINVFILLDRE